MSAGMLLSWAALQAGVAEASTRFLLTAENGYRADWVLRDSDGPSSWAGGLEYQDVLGTELGTFLSSGWRSIFFSAGGGLTMQAVNGNFRYRGGGPVLFSGPEFHWTWNLGTHSLSRPGPMGGATLVISDVPVYHFRLTGENRDIRFALEAMPEITFMGTGFRVNDVAATSNGVATTFGQIRFLSNGGLQLGTGPSALAFAGTLRAFDGPRQYPEFRLGSFDLTSGTGAYSLSISTMPFGIIPEPASWAMMIVGFAAVGVAARRRQAIAGRRG